MGTNCAPLVADLFLFGGSVVVDFLLIVTLILGICNCNLVALLGLSSWCLVMVVWLFLAVPWGCLRFLIVVFPNHTHLLFFDISGTL